MPAAAALGRAERGDERAAAADDDFGHFPALARDIARSAPRLYVGEERLKFYAEQIGAALGRAAPGPPRLPRAVHRAHAARSARATSTWAARPRAAACGTASTATSRRTSRPGCSRSTRSTCSILNLLSERQLNDLWDARSADFSYQILGESGEHLRFRCTAYYDNLHLGVCLRAINDTVRPIASARLPPGHRARAAVLERQGRPRARHRRDGLGQEHDARRHHRRQQPRLRRPHRHHREAARVRPRAGPLHHPPPRGRAGRAVASRRASSRRCARTPTSS